MNISTVVADFGAYYIDEGQNRQRLISLLENTDDTLLSRFPLVNTADTKRRFALTSIVGDVLQPFQKAWTPRGQFKADPLEVEQFKMKVDVEEYPDDLEDTWLSLPEWVSENENRSQWPFVRWMMEAHLLPRLRTNLGDCGFWGVRAEPTPGTPGASRAAYNGVRHLINTAITAGAISPFVLGAVPTDPVAFVEYVEEFVELIPEQYRRGALEIEMNTTLEMRYKVGFDLKYNVNYSQRPNNMSLFYRPNVTIVGHVAAAGSTKIWASIPENRVRMMNKAANASKMEAFPKDVRLVQISTHFFHGIGFKTGSLVWTNDVDLV